MTYSLSALIVSFLALILVGLPIAWSMIASVLVWVVVTGNWHFLPIASERIYQGMDTFVLMAVPLFILSGELVNAGKITDRLLDFANAIFGWMRGGLAQVNVGASILFAGITGVALGDIASLGRVFIPSMVRQGYAPSYAAAVTASSSIIGPMVTNASFDADEKAGKDAATNASASEQTESNIASSIMLAICKTGLPRKVSSTL